jgi:hypothetical protein
MDITDCDDLRWFCFFLSLVWFCLLLFMLFMQRSRVIEFFGAWHWNLDVRSSILGENGCNAIGLTSALEGRQQYMQELQMVCRKKLSTMVLLAERKKTVMFV